MNKRHVLLLTAVLGMAFAQAQAQTAPAIPVSQVKAATKDPNLTSANITVNTGTYVGPLSTLLASIAKSAKYEIVFDFNVDAMQLINGEIIKNMNGGGSATTPTGVAPTTNTDTINSGMLNYATPTGKPDELAAKPVIYNFINKPFNEVWPLLMDVYELQYEVIKIGDGQVIRIKQRPKQMAVRLNNITALDALSKATDFFGIPQYDEIPMQDSSGQPVKDSTGKVMTRKTFIGYRLPDDLRLIADTANSRIIVGGDNNNLSRVQSFIDTIDIPGPVATKLQAYTINGNPDNILKLLNQRYPRLKITNIGNPNSLIIDGPTTDITEALALLGQVDKPSFTGTVVVQKVFQLVNASAEAVKATLQGTLARQVTAPAALPNVPIVATDANGNPTTVTVPNTQASTATATAAAPAATNTASTEAATPDQATIIADQRTNTLIVRGSQSQVDQIAELIPQLDKVVPQVNVQVRIQEVTNTALRTLGMNWGVNFGGFSVKVGSDGLQGSFDPTRNLIGFNILPTLTALENQGLTHRVYDGSVTMQSGQRALGQMGTTQNASSDAAASIKSGGRVEINIPSTAGNIEKEVDYGVNLDFFNPQVAPDGTITLRVRGQISNPSSIPTTGVPNILQFTNSEAQSTITFKSGQTVLMSGLLGTTETNTSAGVPFLSSLPVVGAAFGTQTKQKDQTQLMIIITGTVVQ